MLYYKVRELKEKIDFEESYWGVVKDPDNLLRDKKNERLIYLSDIKDELSFINKQPAGKILDVGCGLGFLLSGVSEKFDKYGVEVSNLACETAQKYCKIYNSTLGDANFPSNYFDIVVLYHVIEHIENPENLIQEINRILKKGGILILGTPNFECFVAKRFKNNFRLLNDKTHISLFSDKSMTKFLNDFGFKIKKIKYPFFKTRHFSLKNILRLIDTSKVSPPFWGNIMTFYCIKK